MAVSSAGKGCCVQEDVPQEHRGALLLWEEKEEMEH